MNIKLNRFSITHFKLDKMVSLKTLSIAIFAMAFAVSSLLVLAEVLRDPTQIPDGFYTNHNSPLNETSTIEPAANTPTLQSVMLSNQMRAAIINGKKVLLGQKYEAATLVTLSENTATLRYPDGTRQTLYMNDSAIKKIPIVQIQPIKNKQVIIVNNAESNSVEISNVELNNRATQVTRANASMK